MSGLAALAVASAAFADGRSDFVTKAMKGDNSEMMLGRFAEQRAASPKVRAYGRTLFVDHSKGKAQAVALARSMGIQPTDEPMDVAKDERQKLMGMNGQAFDREFVSYMIKDHQEDISDFRKAAESRDGRVSAFARTTLPVLHKHLDIALRLKR
jgi:putative membrane protein